MTTTKPEGMCERLFNAINTNPTFRPLRRLTFNQQNPEKQSEQTNSRNKTHPTTQPKPPQEKPTVALKTTPNNKMGTNGPQKAKPTPVPVPPKDLATPVPPKGRKAPEIAVPTPVLPKGATIPQPARPAGATAVRMENEAKKPKKNINEKVEDYIQRTKNKLRSTTLERTRTSK